MTLESNPHRYLAEIEAIARSVGWGASKILQAYYRGEVNQGDLEINEDKKDGPVTAADIATNRYILDKLQRIFGDSNFGYLSEETHQQGNEPLSQEWVWVIDPLDGTRDFIDKTGEYAIHIALTYRKRPVVAVVAIPEAEKVYFATQGFGTFVETSTGEITPLQLADRDRLEDLTLVVSRTHRDQRFQQLIERLPFKNHHYVGSVGCKITTILEHQSDVYISLSGKSAAKDWDFAAPELILTAAGGSFTYFNGDPLLYNRGDVCQWGGIMASPSNHHAELCQQATKILAEIDGK